MRAVHPGGDRLGGSRVALLGAIGLLALAACQSEPTGPVSVPLSDAGSIRLFTAVNSSDWTSHLPLTRGEPVRLKVKLYTTNGHEIAPLLHPLDMSFSVDPATLATTVVADSGLLLFDITATDPAGTDGALTVTLTEPSSTTTKTFGPFQVLVH